MDGFIHLIAEKNVSVFLIMTLVMGGSAAFSTGRAIALTWRPFWQVVFYMILLASVLRFFHWSLFSETLLSWHYYSVDFSVLIVFAALGYRLTRTDQIIRRYHWLYEKNSPLNWQRKEKTSNTFIKT